MSIFKRTPGSVPQGGGATAVETPQQAQPASAGTAPGVVPPAAAPVYSTRAQDPAPQATGSVSDRMKAARAAQQGAQQRVRVALQRARSTASSGAGRQVQQAATRRSATVRQAFDPLACAQTGLLNLAWSWQEAGAPIRAIHTYMQLLARYPATAAADAAVADLVELSEKLAGEGQFHTALAIYEHLERLEHMQ